MADRERFSALGVDHWGTGSVAVGLCTTPLAGRSWIQFPMVLLQFFTDISSGRTVALGSTQPLTERSVRGISLG